jgi:hypothetical protein
MCSKFVRYYSQIKDGLGVDWNDLVQNRDQWWTLVNRIMKLWRSIKGGQLPKLYQKALIRKLSFWSFEMQRCL